MNRRLLTFASTVVVTSACATLAHAQTIVVVPSDATCPSVEMLRAALPVRPNGEWPQQTVTVEVAGDRLSLSLGEAPAARREIPTDRDCSVRAQNVAVVIATWSGELGSRPTDSRVLTAENPKPVPILTVASPAAAPTPAKRSNHVFELDGAGFYSLSWGHAPGAWLGVGRLPRYGGFGVRLLGAYQSARDVALEGGSNQILRFFAGAALTYHLQRTHFFASGDAGLVGTLTRAQGTGYQANRADSTTNFGGVAELRGGLRFGRARLWLNARVLSLVHADTVKVESTSPGVGDRASLSRWDGQLGAGLGFRFE